MKEVLLVVTALLGIIGLIFLSYYAARWLSKKAFTAQGRTIRLIERQSISQDKYLLVVKVGGKAMLLGVSQNNIEKISDLDEEDIAAAETETMSISAPMTFAESFKKVLSTNPYTKPFCGNKDGKNGESKNDSED